MTEVLLSHSTFFLIQVGIRPWRINHIYCRKTYGYAVPKEHGREGREPTWPRVLFSNHFQVHFRLGFELIFNSFSMFGYQTRAFRQKSEPTHPIGAI